MLESGNGGVFSAHGPISLVEGEKPQFLTLIALRSSRTNALREHMGVRYFEDTLTVVRRETTRAATPL